MVIFDKIGIIQNGEYKGWNIVIQDMHEKMNAGYMVIMWDSIKGYDDFYETYDLLLINIKDYEIVWTDEIYQENSIAGEKKLFAEELINKLKNSKI